MILKAIDSSEVARVYEWLTDPQNNQWLEFPGGLQSPLQLRLLLERETHYLRLFKASPQGDPLGLVGLSDINRTFGTAMIWAVLGDRSHVGKYYTTQAVSRLLEIAFGELGLRSIHAWTVETNTPALKLLKHNGFRFMGRQRQCHVLKGQVLDRLWFDLLSSEYQPRFSDHPKDQAELGLQACR
jgi:RimJ/RimL family protein N-acetyltransferase